MAKELGLTGEIIDGETAQEYGLVNHVFDVEEFEAEADRIIDRIANGPPIALRHSKRLLSKGLETEFTEALEKEATAQAVATESDDYREGIEAISEGREPQFTGR
jgi:enoyl-CoA hydratase/carnithine racemase